MFIQALDVGETAVLCCPSGYEAVRGGGCFSTLPAPTWSHSELCLDFKIICGGESNDVTFTYDDKTYTAVVPIDPTQVTMWTNYATT